MSIKHEPTNTKQIQYPGGKNGMWNSTCSAGDYVAPPSNTKEQAEAKVRQHAASKADKAASTQVVSDGDGGTTEICMEIAEGRVELNMHNKNKFSDHESTYSVLEYDQLWEHVHNCLDALERMGRDQKPKVQL